MHSRPSKLGAFYALALCLAAAPAAAESIRFMQRIEPADGSGPVESSVIIDGQAFRMETNSDGNLVVLLRNSDGLYNLLPEQNTALRLPEAAGDFELLRHAGDYAAFLESQQAQHIGDEDCEGKPCAVYSIPGQGSTVWVGKEPFFPVKVESAEARITFSGVAFGEAADPALFTLPEGVQVLDLAEVDLEVPSEEAAFEQGAGGEGRGAGEP